MENRREYEKKFLDINYQNMKLVRIHRKGETLDYKFRLLLPEELAEWDVWDYWEFERIESMQMNVREGDLMLYVGAESGWMPAIISKYITSHIALVEPSLDFWNCIELIWKENKLKKPILRYQGFISDIDSRPRGGVFKVGKELVIKSKYESLNRMSRIPRIKIDSLGFIPKVISIDIEGAEYKALRGGHHTLLNNDILVYVSVHPDLCLRDFNYDSQLIFTYMESLGYKWQLLGRSHEDHYVFYKNNLIVKNKETMKVNFNNTGTEVVTKATLPAFFEKVRKAIEGNTEHFWLEYKKNAGKKNEKSIEKKWDRRQYTDAEILKDVEKFIKPVVK